MIRTRFAPSPTGSFHVGGARTALFNYLFAKQNKGKFLLRIEDTDQTRFDPNALQELYSGLDYLGLTPDESPIHGGAYGPYVQTERLGIYKNFCELLLNKGLAYRVFSNPDIKKYSQEELRAMPWKKRSQLMQLYHWRNANSFVVKKMLAQEIEYHVRLKLPRVGDIEVEDRLRGKIRFQWTKQRDPVIMKTDGIPTYHFANVIDDSLMRVSHVIRGEEWLSSLPIHWFLYDSLEMSKPEFIHLPLILNPVGTGKLSKRKTVDHTGSEVPVFVKEYMGLGYLREAMVNYLSLLGWNNGDDREFFRAEELIKLFSLDRVSRSAAKWDIEKLNSLQRKFIEKMTPEEFGLYAMPWLPVPDPRISSFKELLQTRIIAFSEVSEWLDFLNYYRPPSPNLLIKQIDKHNAMEVLKLCLSYKSTEQLEERLRTWAKQKKLKPGQVFWPLRVAVTGKEVAPPLFETIDIMGEEESKNRIELSLAILEEEM